VLNKIDLLPEGDRELACQAVIDGLKWSGPAYKISAISGAGTDVLCQDLMAYIEERAEEAKAVEVIKEIEAMKVMKAMKKAESEL
jgi:GTP-binding protein